MTFENEIQACEYLQSTDFYFTVDKYAQLTPERKAELEANREAARQFWKPTAKLLVSSFVDCLIKN
jgi:hypothetical protein